MIREYRPEDLPALVEIGNRAWREIYQMFRECLGEELFRLRVPDETTTKGKQVESHCRQHPEWVFVCEEEGCVAGFATFRLDPEQRIGEIGNNAVDPEFRGRGLAQQMYEAIFEYFRAHGMQYAKVETGLDWAHAPARRAYEKAGFDIRHENVEYYRKL